MKIKPYKCYTGEWILIADPDNTRVACGKEFYESYAEAQADIPRVSADLEIAAQKAISEILAYLEGE